MGAGNANHPLQPEGTTADHTLSDREVAVCPAFPGPRGQTMGSWPGARCPLPALGLRSSHWLPGPFPQRGNPGPPEHPATVHRGRQGCSPVSGQGQGQGQGPQAFNGNIFRTHLCGGIPPTPFSPASSASTVRLSAGSSPLPGRPSHLPSHSVHQPCGRVVWCQG